MLTVQLELFRKQNEEVCTMMPTAQAAQEAQANEIVTRAEAVQSALASQQQDTQSVKI